MIIYLDNDYKCHIDMPEASFTTVDTDVFDGKCRDYIEGYRLVPVGYTWERPDGVSFAGEMITPWKPWRELDNIQREYEREQLRQLDEAYQRGVNSL